MEEKDPIEQTAATRTGDDEAREVEAAVEESAAPETAPEGGPEIAPESEAEAAPETSSSEDEEGVEEQDSQNAEIPSDELVFEEKASDEDAETARLRAVVEAVVYITEDPLTAKQLAESLEEPLDKITAALDALVAEYEKPEHGLVIREVAEGYKMGTKAEFHDSLRTFVKKLQKPLKLSMAALETLAVISYKQPITAPEIMEIRGVQGAGVLKTLLERKLITTAGRKNVVGKPMLYRTTKEFLVQFGLKNLKELPTLKEFEELARVALSDAEEVEGEEETTTENAENAEGMKVAEQREGAELEADEERITAASGQELQVEGQRAEAEAEVDEDDVDPKGPQSETAEAEEPGEAKRHAAPEE